MSDQIQCHEAKCKTQRITLVKLRNEKRKVKGKEMRVKERKGLGVL